MHATPHPFTLSQLQFSVALSSLFLCLFSFYFICLSFFSIPLFFIFLLISRPLFLCFLFLFLCFSSLYFYFSGSLFLVLSFLYVLLSLPSLILFHCRSFFFISLSLSFLLYLSFILLYFSSWESLSPIFLRLSLLSQFSSFLFVSIYFFAALCSLYTLPPNRRDDLCLCFSLHPSSMSLQLRKNIKTYIFIPDHFEKGLNSRDTLFAVCGFGPLWILKISKYWSDKNFEV